MLYQSFMAVMYIEYYPIDHPNSTSTSLIEDQRLPEKQLYFCKIVYIFIKY